MVLLEFFVHYKLDFVQMKKLKIGLITVMGKKHLTLKGKNGPLEIYNTF